MVRNQLPEGVGKKIVEALKRQSDITPVGAANNNFVNNTFTNSQNVKEIGSNSIQETDLKTMNETLVQDTSENYIIEEENASTAFDLRNIKENIQANQQNINAKEETFIKPAAKETSADETMTFHQVPPVSNIQSFSGVPLSEEQPKTVLQNTAPVSIPTNVAVLRNLIASLPVGVTKQTGAQIIRQTLEAMGLPMSSVLKEAQEVQEELNSNTRECMLKIQEFKTNIIQLEQSVQEYQKNINQINDLVSLFLLTDRK